MDARQPSKEYLDEAKARARRLEREEARRQEARRNRFRWAVWCFGLLLAVALVADLRNISSRMGTFRRTGTERRNGDATDIVGGLGGPRYEDPGGLFSLVAPRNWGRTEKPAGTFFNVVFHGPFGMDMGIQAVVTNGMTFERMVENLRAIERNMAADTHMDFAYVGPNRAIKRSVQLYKNRILMLDFLTGDLAHHVQIGIPTELYDEYEPVFLRLMQTYEPGRILPAAEAPESVPD